MSEDRKDYIKDNSSLEIGGCWLWLKYRNLGGYGQLTYKNKRCLAHRHSWESFNGEIPKDLDVLHKCDTPDCVNPDHLFLGTHQDNMEDMINKGRATKATGEDCARSKLTRLEVKSIRDKYDAEDKYTQEVLAKEFGICRTTIGDIVNNRTWRNV